VTAVRLTANSFSSLPGSLSQVIIRLIISDASIAPIFVRKNPDLIGGDDPVEGKIGKFYGLFAFFRF